MSRRCIDGYTHNCTNVLIRRVGFDSSQFACGACMCCDSRGISIKKKHCCARVRCERQVSGPGVICCGNAKATPGSWAACPDSSLRARPRRFTADRLVSCVLGVQIPFSIAGHCEEKKSNSAGRENYCIINSHSHAVRKVFKKKTEKIALKTQKFKDSK